VNFEAIHGRPLPVPLVGENLTLQAVPEFAPAWEERFEVLHERRRVAAS
jgi:hypothetical protein